jgi:hypothetical protein
MRPVLHGMYNKKVTTKAAMKTQKINFVLEIEDEYPPVGVETLNARACGDGTFELMNTPFFIKETAYNDVVFARPSVHGRLEFVTCVKQSKYKAISVILLNSTIREQLINDFQDKDCIIEYGEFIGFKMLAIAIPHTTDYIPLKALLANYQENDELSYAELVA